MTTTVLWFRRDLRLQDHPALLAAGADGDQVLPVFVLDPALVASGGARTARLIASLRSLDAAMDGALVIRTGPPAEVIPALAAEVGARQVHVTRESTPYGRRRDERVEERLRDQGRALVRTGTPYAVGPGTVLTRAGSPYRVFTPFSRAWRDHGWPQPASVRGGAVRGDGARWSRGAGGERLPSSDGGPDLEGQADEPRTADVPGVGEMAALNRWRRFIDDGLDSYGTERDRPDLDATSRLSIHLKLGEIHPRTMLADLARCRSGATPGAQRFVTELCWREFYADVLWHRPDAAWADLDPGLAALSYDGSDSERLTQAWRAGQTGYPVVDAGMRQLLHEGWMHGRVRMITASFLVKDLHVWWPAGARHFLAHLLDGDIASNNLGWQWVAGTGTDAAPYFRIFNPITQGRRFDPDGDFVRRWVPELAHLRGAAAHEPWKHDDGYADGYSRRVVDHAVERADALDRYRRTRTERAQAGRGRPG